jgi:hypothetical protein
MSFKAFIYYCALCGGWAAFLTWGIVQKVGRLGSVYLDASLVGGLLGLFVAAAVGMLDGILNSVGFQRVVRVVLCAVLGLVGGAIGGLVGQFLNSMANVPLVVGWLLAGVLIGASIGAFDLLRAISSGQDFGAAIKKTLNGVYGGLLGGFLGGLPFTFLRDLESLPRSGRTISLVVLGMCIGLMIGLAQVILKEAWIKVEEGFRAGRELMLTRNETTIGRAESCDLGLFGDAAIQKLHARILLQNNRYMLAHAAEDGETWLNDEEVGGKPVPLRSGDRIHLGKCVLLFRERQKRR